MNSSTGNTKKYALVVLGGTDPLKDFIFFQTHTHKHNCAWLRPLSWSILPSPSFLHPLLLPVTALSSLSFSLIHDLSVAHKPPLCLSLSLSLSHGWQEFHGEERPP